jgi:hypothetical protein
MRNRAQKGRTSEDVIFQRELATEPTLWAENLGSGSGAIGLIQRLVVKLNSLLKNVFYMLKSGTGM